MVIPFESAIFLKYGLPKRSLIFLLKIPPQYVSVSFITNSLKIWKLASLKISILILLFVSLIFLRSANSTITLYWSKIVKRLLDSLLADDVREWQVMPLFVSGQKMVHKIAGYQLNFFMCRGRRKKEMKNVLAHKEALF